MVKTKNHLAVAYNVDLKRLVNGGALYCLKTKSSKSIGRLSIKPHANFCIDRRWLEAVATVLGMFLGLADFGIFLSTLTGLLIVAGMEPRLAQKD